VFKISKIPRSIKLKTRGESICPVSKVVDVFEIEVEYVPSGAVLAIEEFKKVVDSYRGVEILHEELAVDILEKIKTLINPPYIKVVLKSTYMGVDIEVVAESGGSRPLYI